MPAKKVPKTPKTQIQNGGRKHKEVDWAVVDQMLEAGCTGIEIAPIFGIHYETLYDRALRDKGVMWTEYTQQMSSKGEGNIKLTQYLKATGQCTKGDTTLLVWLGKNRLKQRENPTELTVSNETVQSFKEIMNQVKSAQEARKIDDTNIISET